MGRLDRMRQRQADHKPRVDRRTLKDGRPAPPAKALDCERCGGDVRADDVECRYGNYWLCPSCADLHRGVAEFAERLARFRGSTMPDTLFGEDAADQLQRLGWKREGRWWRSPAGELLSEKEALARVGHLGGGTDANNGRGE